MNHFFNIKTKLEQFIKRYYLSALLKGALLFFGIGLLYALFWISIEYFFWISSSGRTIVFWALVFFEMILFYKLLCVPLLKYLKIQSGISDQEAAKIIGDFFPEISDKLLNIIQLNSQPTTELIVASIQQKTKEFGSVSFKKAVQFKDNLKYLKYTVLPLMIIGVVYASGGQSNLKQSLNRVVDYKTTYTPPAPFQFVVTNNALETVENQSFVLDIRVEGNVVPEHVKISFENQTYFLKRINNQRFQFKFQNPKKDIQFQVSSENVISNLLELKVLSAPKILNSTLLVDYPTYTKLKDKTVSSFGNISIPEGTKLTWKFLTKSTDTVTFVNQNSVFYFNKDANEFTLSKQVFADLMYDINTNNDQLKNFETLSYEARIIKDRPPLIDVQQRVANSIEEELYFYGQISDDYGISSLQVHYYPVGKTNLKTIKSISFNETFDFTYQFPVGLDLLPDTSYELFFEVIDNDPFPSPNKSRSKTFTYLSKSENALKEEQLNAQKELVDDLENTFNTYEQQQELVDDFTKQQLQKERLNYNDQEKTQDIIKRQKNQDDMIKRFNEQMKKTIEQFPAEIPDTFKKNLSERLDEQNKRLEENEKTLKELEDLAKKMKQEELLDKLQKLGQQSKNRQKNLEQMLELTKRYYVSKKAEQLKSKLEDLSQEQTHQAEKSKDNKSEEQSKLNQNFNNISKELDELRKQNNFLSKPITIPDTKQEELSIQSDQNEAIENLEEFEKPKSIESPKNSLQKANKAQKKAAQKMKQLAAQLAQAMSGGSSMQLTEDIEMLRRILDNLLIFSFEQENLIKQPASVKTIKTQKSLRTHFEHIDDSLFVVSLRQPMISQQINDEISDVYYNIDKTLSSLSESRDYEAKSAQQYTVTSTNNLANLLSDVLNNLEMQMQPNPGQGQGDMQLPDIIMSQEDLQKQAEQMMNGKMEGSEKSNEQEEQGSSEQSGENGKNENSSSGESIGNNPDGSSPSEGQSEIDQYGDPEESSEALFQLYKQQQEIRQNLENILKKEGLLGKGKSTLDTLEELEQLIVNQGVTKEALAKMKALKYEFLKHEDALLKKGMSPKRQSSSNKKEFSKSNTIPEDDIKRLFGTEEILNRKALPLRQNMKKKVQDYFNKKND